MSNMKEKMSLLRDIWDKSLSFSDCIAISEKELSDSEIKRASGIEISLFPRESFYIFPKKEATLILKH